jgi:hypothetical protein
LRRRPYAEWACGLVVSSLVFDVPKRAKWQTSWEAKNIGYKVGYLLVGLVGYAGAYRMAKNSDATYYAFLLWWGSGLTSARGGRPAVGGVVEARTSRHIGAVPG